jgi:hypothetical protein
LEVLMKSRTGGTSIGPEPKNGPEVTTRLTEAEIAELERRACQLEVDCSDLIRRYIRAGLAVTGGFGTVVDVATGERLCPAAEPHVTLWLRSHNSASAPGIFAINTENQPVSLPMAKLADRRVTILHPPNGFDVTEPGSRENLRLLSAMKTAAAAERARWMTEVSER